MSICFKAEFILLIRMKVYAHLHAVNALVVEDAIVIKSGESGAWLANLWGLQVCGASLPTLSFGHLTAALPPPKAHIPGQMHERSYKCAGCSKQGMHC